MKELMNDIQSRFLIIIVSIISSLIVDILIADYTIDANVGKSINIINNKYSTGHWEILGYVYLHYIFGVKFHLEILQKIEIRGIALLKIEFVKNHLIPLYHLISSEILMLILFHNLFYN